MNLNNKPCPCHSQQKYKKCCRPLHQGQRLADSPVELLRSRYCAYAIGECAYILKTTHPLNPESKKSPQEREKELRLFAKHTDFQALEVLDEGMYAPSDYLQNEETSTKEAWVKFHAGLDQGGQDASFEEKSRFILEPVHGWRYASAEELVESDVTESKTSEIQTS